MEKSYQSTGVSSPSRTEITLSHSKGGASSFFKSFAFTLAIFIAGIGSVWGQCTSSSAYGTGAAPAAGTTVTLTTCAYAGEYSTITSVPATTAYTSTSTGGTGNWITIRRGTTTGTVIAQGPSPLNWTSTTAATYCQIVNTTSACGTDAVCHTLSVTRPSAGCTSSSAFGTGVAPAAGATVTLTTCAYAGEYSTITSVPAATAYTSASTGGTGNWITIRLGTTTGTVIAQGASPLNWTSTTAATYCQIVNTTSACGTDAVCHTLTVSRASPPPTITSISPASGCPGSTITINGTNFTGATAANVKVGGTAVTAILTNTGTVITATVGTGTTGTVSVTTSGTATSVSTFTVSSVPLAPTANAATSLTASGFTANWQTVSGATSYILDVSTVNTFASFVTGYTALNVGNVLTKNVTGLSSGTTYYYRVRATNGTCTGANSATITAVTTSAACSGTPAPGNTNTSSASVTSGSTVNLSLQNAISGTGVSYQWQSGPSNTGPWTTFGATSATQTSAALTSTTWFKCNVTCGANTGASTPVQVTVTAVNTIPYSGSASVTCGTSTLIYDHAGSATNYSDNASGFIVLNNTVGSTSVISLTGTYTTEANYDYLRIYDGSGVGGTLLATYTGSGTITPFTSTAGQTITVQFTSDASAVDAGISLNAVYSGSCTPPPCSGTPSPGLTVTSSASVTSGSTVNLSLSTPPTGTGLTYQWQSGPSNTGPWTNVGTSVATYSPTVSATTWFRCNVTCGANTGTATPVQVSVAVANNIPYSGSASVTCGTSTLIYDHAGSATDYLDNASGYLVLDNTAGSTSVISLTGTYATEANFDYLRIYDGSGIGGTLLATYTGSGTITPFTSTAGQTITVQFTSDGSAVAAGISLNAVYSGSCTVPPCSGTPAPGTTLTSSATVAAPSGTVNLSLSTPPTGSGLSYQWQSGPSNTGPWTNDASTLATYSPTVSATTWYQCLVTCSGSTGTSNPVQVTMSYCNPAYTVGTAEGDLISNVVITGTTLSNNTGTTAGLASYNFYTGQPNYTTNMVAANSYNVAVTAGSFTSQNFAAWIDYNDNLVFESSEKIGFSAAATSIGFETVNFTINLSCTPPLGAHRMRVRGVWNLAGSSIDPCTTYGYGETEDYIITIVAGSAFTPTITSPTTSCVGSQVTYTTPVGQTNYSWTPSGVSGTDYTINSGGTSSSNTMTITWLTSGNKTVNYDYASPLGCASSGSQTSSAINFGMGTLATIPNNGNVVWRGSSSTDWATPSNWYTFNSGSYSVAGVAPDNTSSLIIPMNTCVTQQPTIAAGTVNAKDVVIETGAALTMTTGTLNVAGNFTNSGTFTPGTGTVNFMLNGTQTVTIGSSSFYNVGINLGLLPSVVPKVQLTGNTTINGDYTNTSGSLNLNSFDLTIGGNYLNSVSNTGFGDDGLIPGIGNVIFNKASGIQTLSQAQGLDFYTIQHAGLGTLQLTSDLSTTGDIINSAGTFDANDKIITVRNNFTNTAAFTAGPGTAITPGQIYFEKLGGTQTLTSGGAVFQKFAHTGTGILNLSGIVEVKGDVVIDAPISAGTSTMKLSGTIDQTISGTQAVIILKDMTVSKTAGTVTLSKPVKVDGALTMTQGNIITSSANKLEIGSSASSLGSVIWTDGNVVGPMRRWFAGATNSTAASGMFPVGLSTVNRYAQVNFTQAPGSGGYIEMEYKAGAPTTQTPWTYLTTPDGQLIQTFENEGYWDITPYDASGNAYPSGLNTNAFTLKLRANGLTSVNDISVTRIIRSPGPDHTTWEPAGFHITPTGSLSDFVIQSNTVTGFSWFNIGAPNNSPLPVELLNFNGTCEEGMVNLVWQTASEFNSSHFDVEKSTDGETWRVLATVPSAGTSNELLTYQTVDNNGTSGSNYYRLRQVDIDGKEKLYDPINVSCVETTVGYFTSYPNPSGNEFQVIVNNKEILGACTLNIVDAQGKVIDQRSIEVKDGINMFVISETLNPGIYFLNITNGTKTTQVIKHAVK
ncbi:MAG: T9SS type A sorting domain-containing protein [Crocinitomicaceae bacterium]|nr:T9SS type A sorting domain-containing protein [Crocinitomicaceae bacterium]